MENKEKYAFWLYLKTKKLVESHMKDTPCRSQSEFVEDAIRFYCGHLDVNTGEAIGYLAPVLNGIVKAEIAGTEQRLARLLFKVAVELGAITHLTAASNDVDDEVIDKLRAMCVDEVRRINGTISFEKAIAYQKG